MHSDDVCQHLLTRARASRSLCGYASAGFSPFAVWLHQRRPRNRAAVVFSTTALNMPPAQGTSTLLHGSIAFVLVSRCCRSSLFAASPPFRRRIARPAATSNDVAISLAAVTGNLSQSPDAAQIDRSPSWPASCASSGEPAQGEHGSAVPWRIRQHLGHLDPGKSPRRHLPYGATFGSAASLARA
jgi:hypothetical protein